MSDSSIGIDPDSLIFKVIIELNEFLPFRLLPSKENENSKLGIIVNQVFLAHESGNYYERDICCAILVLLLKHLKVVRDYNEELYRSFRRALIRSRNYEQFFGVRFELAVCSGLIRKSFDVVKQESPDFLINNSEVSLECTSCRLDVNKEESFYKIQSAIRNKSNKPYAKRSAALLIDATNIYSHNLLAKGLIDQEGLKLAINTTEENKYGSVLVFHYVANARTNKFEFNYTRVDHPQVTHGLNAFLNDIYPFGSHLVQKPAMPFEG